VQHLVGTVGGARHAGTGCEQHVAHIGILSRANSQPQPDISGRPIPLRPLGRNEMQPTLPLRLLLAFPSGGGGVSGVQCVMARASEAQASSRYMPGKAML
jgi:hypothetical protein